MRVLSEYKLQFEGLKQGTHFYEFDVDNKFFEEFDWLEFDKSSFKVDLKLEKQSTMMVFNFDFKGSFSVPCDRCLDEVEIGVEGSEKLIVKFGTESYDDTDDILVLPESEHEIDVSPYVYEFIMLNIPQKRVHKKGACNKKVIKAFEKVEQKNENEIDPRWATLKDINLEK